MKQFRSCIGLLIVLIIGVGIGVLGTTIVGAMYTPSHELLAKAWSPDGYKECIVERYEPATLGDVGGGVP